ncbi:MAG: hypothetical protein IT365_06095 [Candidatus Hydrogenedentes bacterium]|nr:hypothetical protein [Candidatus Hydrogenedentota bacterium]
MSARRHFLFCLLILSVAIVRSLAVELPPETVDAIRAEVAGPFDQFPQFGESTAEAFVLKRGSDVVPILIEIVQDESLEPRNKVKAAFYLGKFEDPRAVQPLIALFENSIAREIPSERRRMMGFCLDALGFTDHPDAFAFLEKCAGKQYWEGLPVQPTVPEDGKDEQETQRYFREWALRGLGVASRPQAVDILEELRDGAASDLTDTVDEWIRVATQRVEMTRAATVEHTPKDAAAFWKYQTFPPCPTLQKDIVGRYSGEVYDTFIGGTEPFVPLTGVEIEFSADGQVRTNLEELLLPKERRWGPLKRVSEEWAEGRYRVLGPTQLALAPGKDVTAFAIRYRDGMLTFCHLQIRAYFSFRKEGTSAPALPTVDHVDFSGVYEGVAFVADESVPQIKEVDDVRVLFSENGYITTYSGSSHDKTFATYDTSSFNYRVDSENLISTNLAYSGGDFGQAEASGSFDWHWQDGQIHFNTFHGAHYGAACVLAPKGQSIHLNQESALRQLTMAPYAGTAYRASLDGTIEEIPGIELAFSADGTYQSNFPDKLRDPNDQYYPEANGPYVVLTDRQLYMAQRWDSGLTDAGITDVLIQDDRLWFTSLTFDAYFSLRRARSASEN